MIKGLPSVDFNLHDDLILDLLKRIVYSNGLNHFTEIYFSQKDGVPSVDCCSLACIQKMLLHGCIGLCPNIRI